MISEIMRGALISASLIIAIGAQNLFVLKQGLLKNHIFFVSAICFICDFTLMSIGILGVGSFISANPLITNILAILGAIFLIWYGYNAFKSALKGTSSMQVESQDNKNNSLMKVVLATLAVTLLNPHVYLDTVVIVGGIAGTLSSEQKMAFLIGAVCVSFLWFFGIGYGARLLTPLFKQKRMWVILDCIVGLVMFYIAYRLIMYVFLGS
ncbi:MULTISPECIES: LysE/ArgO family amino acid transporter [unclassified Gilliamella]|uniref:LysE/ArgO family amino acid transporter n=1 Tax=unclassified Gilliamella TaxID=2685620 RepID=UPI001C6A699A|nr:MULTISPECIES: LysE/ArgO family amino acid transporter [unclassified Gilliamella]MCX8601036.1 amino acid transporter [Gilliamella sp. B3722]MCX8608309.1 amino acid transporter [Gilliamella sp. B3771]MCX8610258.1 amino acid transporter [Gilliamella sp. B3891]MCX8612482.1 amino acid transporter [Gilliamella sp. B3773]MCX8616296.1 amino acid transporter [Gilliamella sp. B3770]